MVEMPWQALWDEDEHSFWFYHGLTEFSTWDTPCDMPACWECIIEVGSGVLRFYNAFLNKYNEDAEGFPVMPSVKPPLPDVVLACPVGWCVGWSGSQQSFYWHCDATGENTMEPPFGEKSANGVLGGVDREELVHALQQDGLLPVGEDVSDANVRLCYRKFVVKYHPDKNLTGKEFFQKHEPRFKLLLEAITSVSTDSHQGCSEAQWPLVLCDFSLERGCVAMDHGDHFYLEGQIPVCAWSDAPADFEESPKDLEREWGLVAMERGEHTTLEMQLRAYACSPTPEDSEDSIKRDGWWAPPRDVPLDGGVEDEDGHGLDGDFGGEEEGGDGGEMKRDHVETKLELRMALEQAECALAREKNPLEREELEEEVLNYRLALDSVTETEANALFDGFDGFDGAY
jgi:hypothetical protein